MTSGETLNCTCSIKTISKLLLKVLIKKRASCKIHDLTMVRYLRYNKTIKYIVLISKRQLKADLAIQHARNAPMSSLQIGYH